ncbi:MAG: glycosyltransferase [Actinomycetota bacterium]|nr:glycosyltransferase [Actinomycetota bacterium]
MRICIIGNARAVHLQRWARAYRDAGHHVEIVSIRNESIPGIRVRTVSVGHVNDPSTFWSFLSYARLAAEARRVVGHCNPDVVHAHFTTTSGVFARTSGRHPVVVTAWGSDVIPANGKRQSPVLQAINRWSLGGADRVTVASRFLAGWVKEAAPNAAIDVVPFGVDTKEFHPRMDDRPSDGLSIGLVKSLEPRYGIEHAIRAMDVVRSAVPGAVLTIAGGGSLRGHLEEVASDLDLGHAVEFVGRVDHEAVPQLMRSFDILLNTTVVPESFGVVILEGSATGLPVITSDVGGVHEVCIADNTALLIAPADESAIAEAIISLAGDPAERARLGAAGREFVQEHFEWDRSVAAMLGVLADAVRQE